MLLQNMPNGLTRRLQSAASRGRVTIWY